MTKQPENNTVNLYWVSCVDDCSEDWFMIATSERQAERAHEGWEGFEPGSATARLVLADVKGPFVQKNQEDKDFPVWAQIPDLERFGFEILKRPPEPRVVRFKDETFIEGALQHTIDQLQDDQAESQGGGRPNRTQRRGAVN